jgi:hypothetical protein
MKNHVMHLILVQRLGSLMSAAAAAASDEAWRLNVCGCFF